MNKGAPTILSELEQPILFRTTSAEVYRSTLDTGLLWLRSDQYYREIEDRVRADETEGVTCGRTGVPLRFESPGGPRVEIQGEGSLGQVMQPHYLLSLHGASLSRSQHAAFGGHTFGIRSLYQLSAEMVFRATQVLRCTGYRYGQISYQYASHRQTLHPVGASVMLGGNPPVSLNVCADVLRKRPVAPFIEQDEWRIAIFTDQYLGSDPNAPLRIQVATSNFYRYLEPQTE